MPCTPTAMRAPFIMRNICRMPMCGWPPTRMPRQPPFSPKLRTAVADARIPSLCSIDAVTTSFGLPSEPSSFTQIFGTMKSERPFVPAGAPSMRARTRWTMFSQRSWSPAEIQHFVPVIS